MAADGDKLIQKIRDQHLMIEDMRAQHSREVKKATKKLAQLIEQTSDHPDRGVNYSAAARAMGTVRSYTQGLVRRLNQGEFN